MPDSGVCAISPSDLVGYVGNLINRVKELEQQVAEIQAGNIVVNQLSDLSQQVGWVGGVEYMGLTGWTQTEYGTILPPAGVSFSTLGFTLSDGNTYPFVVMDENGVLQFGFTNTGAVRGAASTSGSTSILQIKSNTVDINTISTYVAFDEIHPPTQGSDLSWSLSNPTKLVVETEGLYMFIGNMFTGMRAVVSNAQRGFTMQGSRAVGGSAVFTRGHQVLQDKTTGTGTTNPTYWSATHVDYMYAGDYVRFVPVLFTPDTCGARLVGIKLA